MCIMQQCNPVTLSTEFILKANFTTGWCIVFVQSLKHSECPCRGYKMCKWTQNAIIYHVHIGISEGLHIEYFARYDIVYL